MKPKGKPNKKPSNPRNFNFYWIYAVIGVLLIGIQLFNFNTTTKPVDWKTFSVEMLEDGDVAKLVVITNENLVEIFIKPDSLMKEEKYADVRKAPFGQGINPGPHYKMTIGSVEDFKNDLREIQKDLPVEDRVTILYDTRRDWMEIFIGWILPILIFVGIWMFIMRRMGGGGAGPGSQIFNIGKSKAQLVDPNTSKVTFKDVAGLEGAKEEVQEIVDFLKNPQKYTALGAKIPKGALLVGPPGTGKTLLAKAVAGEAKVPFFSLSGSDFVEMFVGVGASRVRDLFRQAKEKAPCIIFIDEIDAIGRARGKGPSFSANDERENTLNQLLTEMDGFGTNSGVIILGATNRADILDRALLRPGRFDRLIYVDLPEYHERKEIFEVHLRNIKYDKKSVDIDLLARQTPGFSGADIANICNEAALIAARKKKKIVEKQDFLDAIDRIVAGLEKKNKLISPKEKKVIAFHESGHATVSWLLEHASPLVKVTIVPRGKSLGAAWYMPEERQITTRAQMLDEMCAALGGRAAEEVIFGEISTGALSDLEKVTKQAYAMVSIYGLDEELGHISYYDSTGQSEYNFQKPYSEKTAELIDKEVKKIIDEAYFRAKEILSNNKDKLVKLAEKLLEKEVIFKEDLEEIFGKRPWDKEHVIDMETRENDNKKAVENPKQAERTSSHTTSDLPENSSENTNPTSNSEKTPAQETTGNQAPEPTDSDKTKNHT